MGDFERLTNEVTGAAGDKTCASCRHWTQQWCRSVGTCDAGAEWRTTELDHACDRYDPPPPEGEEVINAPD